MDEYIFILEQLEKLQLEERLAKLSKNCKNKKVVLFGVNNALNAICYKYDLKKYFNIIGICDDIFIKENVFQYKGFKVISIQNLYFSGADVILNLKGEFSPIEENFRKNNLIKKRVKIIHLLKKPLMKTISTFYEKLKTIFNIYKIDRKFLAMLKGVVSYNNEELISKLNYVRKIKTIKENTEKQIRILFMVQTCEAWTLEELYHLMKSDDNFKVLPIVLLPPSLNLELISKDECMQFFKNKDMECVDGFDYDTQEAVMLKALKPDIIFYQQPEFLRSDFSTSKMSEYALTCFVENEFSLLNSDKSSNFIQDRLNNTWRIFTFGTFKSKHKENIIETGFTKFEEYKNPIKECFENIWSKAVSVKKNRIIYAPSYSINENFKALKFKEQQDYFFNFAATHPQYSFVVMPHYDLECKCFEKGIFTLETYESIKKQWNSLPNVSIVDYTSEMEIFKTSDMLITDSINIASDYFPGAKPILFLENNNEYLFNSLGEKIFHTFYRPTSVDALEIILEDILVSGSDYKSKERNLILSKYHDLFYSRASKQIIDYIKGMLISKREKC